MSSGRQVVVASFGDASCNIPSLEPRLCSRLSVAALVVEIRAAGTGNLSARFCTTRPPLRQVSNLPDSVIELLVVQHTGANIRELEHHLTGLAAFASLHGRPIDDDLDPSRCYRGRTSNRASSRYRLIQQDRCEPLRCQDFGNQDEASYPCHSCGTPDCHVLVTGADQHRRSRNRPIVRRPQHSLGAARASKRIRHLAHRDAVCCTVRPGTPARHASATPCGQFVLQFSTRRLEGNVWINRRPRSRSF